MTDAGEGGELFPDEGVRARFARQRTECVCRDDEAIGNLDPERHELPHRRAGPVPRCAGTPDASQRSGDRTMSNTVGDCMNPQLVYIREGDRADLALRPILEFGITAVPVIDDEHRPVGMVSIRELVDPGRHGEWVSTSMATVALDVPIAVAARTMAEGDLHQMVVLDAEGRAAGMLSALDVVRGLLGLAAKHPTAIDAFDSAAPMP
jgi:CBS domain-containing protein